MQNEALNEYVAVIFADRKNGNNPSTIEKADEVCRTIAAKQTATRLESIRTFASTSSAPLPTKSYCRKFFESLPCVHSWRIQYKSADREELSNKLKTIVASKAMNKNDETFSLIEILTVSLDLSCLDIANSLFTRAFLTINTALELMQNYEKNGDIEINDDNNKLNQLLSLLYELKGIENMFRRDDKGALTSLKKSIQYDCNNLEANLVLCILHLELVQIKEVRTPVLTY